MYDVYIENGYEWYDINMSNIIRDNGTWILKTIISIYINHELVL